MCLGLTVPMVLFIGVELISPGSTGRKVAVAAGDRKESLQVQLHAAAAKPGKVPARVIVQDSGAVVGSRNDKLTNPGAGTDSNRIGPPGSPGTPEKSEPKVVLGPELESEQGPTESEAVPDRRVPAVVTHTRPRVRIAPEIEPLPATENRTSPALEERLAGIQTNLDKIGRTLDAQTEREQALLNQVQQTPRIDPVAQVTELLRQFNEARQRDVAQHPDEPVDREEVSEGSDSNAAGKPPATLAPEKPSETAPREIEPRDKEQKPQPVTRIYRPRYLSGSALQALVEPLLTRDLGKTGAADAESIDAAADGGAASSGSFANALVVRDLPQVMRKIDQLIIKLDVPPTQIVLEAVVITLQLNPGTPHGIDLRTFKGTGASAGQTFAVSPVDAEQASLATGGLTLTSGFGLKSGVLTGDPQAFIGALEAALPVRSARAWQMTVVNRQSAALMLSDPFGPSGNGNEFATGSVLKIRPVVGRTGIGGTAVDRGELVRLDVRREAALDGTASGSRSAALTNQIALKAGQTAILGGFFAEQTAVQFYRRSGIGQLPFVGDLFLKQAEVVERCETIVLLTPRIIAPAADADPQFVRKRQPAATKPVPAAAIQASHVAPANPPSAPVRPLIKPRQKP